MPPVNETPELACNALASPAPGEYLHFMRGPERQVKFRKLRHYDIHGHAHYLTFSCWQNRPFLSTDRARQWFMEALEHARAAHPFDLWAWVIMLEHVHMMVLPHEGVRISVLLKSLKQRVAWRATAWVKENRPEMLASMLDRQPSGRCCYRFWQPGTGYDRNIWIAKELHEKIVYIHANPVRRGLASEPNGWPWSSWHAWESGQDVPIRIDRETLPQLVT